VRTCLDTMGSLALSAQSARCPACICADTSQRKRRVTGKAWYSMQRRRLDVSRYHVAVLCDDRGGLLVAAVVLERTFNVLNIHRTAAAP
jgi:hypothetical protein